jgi:hypothetical protein
MSDELSREIGKLRDSGKIPETVAQAARRHPEMAETLLRLHRVEHKTDNQSEVLAKLVHIAELQSIAIFGSPELKQPGLISDVRDTRNEVYRGKWMISGAIALGGFLFTCLGFWIEWSKH